MSFYTIIVGFIIGSLFAILIKQQEQKHHGPDSNIIKQNIYYDIDTNTCFKLIPKLCSDS